MAGFVAELDRINAVAEASPGFVWRLVGDGNNATDVPYDPEQPNILVNLSVWEDLDSLKAFVYKSDHKTVLADRAKYQAPLNGPHLVAWWVPAGYVPTVDDARAKIAHLAAHGPTADAFTFATAFPAPGA